MTKLTDAELKAKIREQIKQEEITKEEGKRYARLRAEVIVEDKWDFWASSDEERDNLRKWYDEWANSDPELYLDMITKLEMPNYHEQRYKDPDDYIKDFSLKYSIYKYCSKKDKKAERDSNVKAAIYGWSGFLIVVGTIVYFILR